MLVAFYLICAGLLLTILFSMAVLALLDHPDMRLRRVRRYRRR